MAGYRTCCRTCCRLSTEPQWVQNSGHSTSRVQPVRPSGQSKPHGQEWSPGRDTASCEDFQLAKWCQKNPVSFLLVTSLQNYCSWLRCSMGPSLSHTYELCSSLSASMGVWCLHSWPSACLCLVNLSFVSLIYRASANKLKMGRGKCFFPPPLFFEIMCIMLLAEDLTKSKFFISYHVMAIAIEILGTL